MMFKNLMVILTKIMIQWLIIVPQMHQSNKEKITFSSSKDVMQRPFTTKQSSKWLTLIVRIWWMFRHNC